MLWKWLKRWWQPKMTPDAELMLMALVHRGGLASVETLTRDCNEWIAQYGEPTRKKIRAYVNGPGREAHDLGLAAAKAKLQ